MAPSPLALRRAAAAGVLALLLVAAAVALLGPARRQHRQPGATGALSSTAPALQPGERRPLLVIDAGSSGTRVHAFRLELAGGGGGGGGGAAAAALGRRGGPSSPTPKNDHDQHPFAVRGIELIPASAAPAALPSAGDGKKGMYDRVETRPGLDQVVAGPQGRADPEAVLQARALGPLLDWAAAALRATEGDEAEAEGGGGGGRRRSKRSRRPPTTATTSATPAPVFFGGTGGLRRMPPLERERLLEAARHVLRSDARLAFEGGGGGGSGGADATPAPTPTAAAAAAGVLPGAREAAFGWVATNWARGLIVAEGRAALKKEEEKDEPATMGVLDLGGASLEVAFEVEEEEEGQEGASAEAKAAAAGNTGGAAEEAAETAAAAGAAAATAEDPFARPPSAVVELRVGGAGRVRRVHTHAFHGYGLNEAYDRAVTRLLEEQQQEREQEAAVAAATGEAATPDRRAGGGEDGRAGLALALEGEGEGEGDAAATAATTAATTTTRPPRRWRRLASSEEEEASAKSAGGDAAAAAAAAEEAHAADAAVAAMQAPRPSGRAVGVGGAAGAADAASTGGAIAPAPPPTPVVRHPCLHAGYEAPYERITHRHSHHADPEEQAAAAAASSGPDQHHRQPPLPGPAVVTLVGAPDWPACRALMAAVVDAGAPCARHPRPAAGEECRLGALQPALRGRRFAALSGFDAIWRFLLLLSGGGGDGPQGEWAGGGTTEALLEAAERWCAAPWPFDSGLAARLNPQAARSVNAERYCAWAPYAAALLREGLGLSDGDFEVGGGGGGGAGVQKDEAAGASERLGAVGWPLGAALVEGPRLLEEAAAAAAAVAAAGGRREGPQGRPAAGRPLLPMLLLGVLAAGVLGVAIAAFGASSPFPPPPPRGGWVGLGPAGRWGGGGGGGGKGGGSGNGLLLQPALLPMHAAPSMLSLRSSSFAPGPPGLSAASAASSPGSPRAFASSSSFSFGSSSTPHQPLSLSLSLQGGGVGGGGGAAPRREASPTLWRAPSPLGGGSTGSLRGL